MCPNAGGPWREHGHLVPLGFALLMPKIRADQARRFSGRPGPDVISGEDVKSDKHIEELEA
jgi:hypothetical protein